MRCIQEEFGRNSRRCIQIPATSCIKLYLNEVTLLSFIEFLFHNLLLSGAFVYALLAFQPTTLVLLAKKMLSQPRSKSARVCV